MGFLANTFIGSVFVAALLQYTGVLSSWRPSPGTVSATPGPEPEVDLERLPLGQLVRRF